MTISPIPPRFLDRLRAPVSSSGVGVWLNPLPLGELVWNENTKAHFHLPPDATPTVELFYERIHEDDRERVRQAVDRAISEELAFDQVYRTVGPGGALKWIHAAGQMLRGDDGQPRQFDGITLDITDRVLAQQRVREFADTAPAVLWVTEADGFCSFLSRAWTDYTGQSEAAGLGFGWLEMVHPDDRAETGALFEKANAGRVAFSLEHRLRHADGTWRWVIDAGTPRLDATGVFLGFAGSVTDIHDRFMAEQALRKSTERYVRLLASIDEGFCVVQMLLSDGKPVDYRFIETNAVFERQTGLVNPLGRTALELVPDLEPFWFDTYGDVALTGTARRFTHGSQAMGRWFDVFASPIGEPGELQVAILFRDVSQQVETERRLLEADRLKDEFLATLAHELRNPLAPIVNGAELLRRMDSNPSQLRIADIIGRQAGHLARMVDDLMDVSRISRGKLELRMAPLVLQDVVRVAVENASDALRVGNHPIEVDMPPEPVRLLGDEVRLVQVLLNLLTNAARYSAAGRPVTVQGVVHAAGVDLHVRDEGIGIAAEELERVFEMFYQVGTDTGRTSGGMGIGLSLVQRLTELHGGTVEVKSEGLGRGSEFTVRLPLLPAEPTAAPRQDAGALAPPPRRVLIVDDNRDAADTLAEMLRLIGYEAFTAYDGVEGVAQAEALRPDAVLLDLGMPRLDGYGACKAIRAGAHGKHMAVVALSGWGQTADTERTREAGFDGHLVKPVPPDDLVATLEALLQNPRAS
ncbi:PAS domain-containing protein [Hydrogenophaga sp.]|uniref:hybrid sensor histidine kinase/response regulator n=1 Tax=Hydrogenophaga sp. TaxID=1904254 RepID=UPI00271C6EBD|nr:PAS domain-containing protein [Hydrogenophaga sp.]MDO9436603.1 PAS domain-containing protein [Hydrogenophaga sp.]